MKFEEVLKIDNIRIKVSKLKSREFLELLKELTKFLPEDANIGERVYCLDNNINERHKCYCGNQTKYLNYSLGYSERCSRKCIYGDQRVSEKRKKTNIEKYGFSSYTKTKEYLDKTKSTNLERYGSEFYLQSQDKFEKSVKTNLEKYGACHHMKSKEFIEKFKQINIEKFGTDNVSKLEVIKNKKKLKFQKNYGIDHIFCSNELKQQYMMNKYGVNHNTELDFVLKKMKETGIKNGNYLSDEQKSEFEIYRKLVENITSRNKKELFGSWDGKDYYDGDDILDNLNLDPNDARYPTIDHKISIHLGFENKIDPLVIGRLENLCITKRSINSSKNKLSESDFKKRLI